MTRYVALYCRISIDRRGRKEGVQAQERWGRTYAAATWPGVPVRVFKDNHLSAADDDVVRPDYENLRAAINRGEVAVKLPVDGRLIGSTRHDQELRCLPTLRGCRVQPRP